jgi:hypothetical protein
MAVSTAPTAVTNLLTAITNQTANQTPSGYAFGIVRGEPQANLPLDEAIYIMQVANRTLTRVQMVGGGGYGYLREDYVIPVEIRVLRGGDNAVDVETRAWTLIAAVETAIRADLTLNGAVIEAWPESNDLMSEWISTPRVGRHVTATVNVHCWSHI